jgi:hypothetical protein
MRSPARAIAWEFVQRHRLGLIAIAGYVLGLTTIGLLIPDPARFVDEVGPGRYAALFVVPLTSAMLYLLAVFSFGQSGDVAASQSMYPTRMFTLPVSTAALAGWPMLCGTAAMAGLWLATARLALWPTGIAVPVAWPALFLAVFLAWTQVLTWTAYPVPGLRVVVAVVWLVALDVVAVITIELQPPDSLMVAILAPQLPLAYLAARAAVSRARRGDVPDWSGAFVRLAEIARIVERRHKGFASPARAQEWFEWRQHGWSLPAIAGVLLPFEFALLFVDRDVPAFAIVTIVSVLLTPPLMAAFVAATVGKANPGGRDGYGLPPFIATRPMTSATLIAAKLRVTLWSTLVTWLLVSVAVPVALSLSDTWPVVIDRARQVRDVIGTPRAVVVSVLVLSALVAATWKRLVVSLYVGLSGRAWLIRTHLGVNLALLVAIVPLIQWIADDGDAFEGILHATPGMAAVLACLKVAAAGWIAARLSRSGLVDDRTLVTAAALWLVTVLALYALLVWLMSSPHFARYMLALLAVLAVPLARLFAAPLALAWNRHR